MQSDIFGDGKQPILADYLQRMDKKSGAKTKANSKERSEQKLLQLSGRKKKSGDANERDLGETSTPFYVEFEQGEMHQTPLRDTKKIEEAVKESEEVKVEIVDGVLEVKVQPSSVAGSPS